MERLRKMNSCFGLLIILQIINNCKGFETYFPLSGVHVTIPQNVETIKLLRNRPLAQFTAEMLHPLYRGQERIENKFRYEIEKNKFLSINESNGNIWISNQLNELKNTTTFIISAYGSSLSNPNARMSLTVTPIKLTNFEEFCGNISRLCFWDSILYTVVENSSMANKIIGSIGPSSFEHLCQQHSIRYVLLNATTLFTISNKMLKTITRFDHDSFHPGPYVSAKVQCHVRNHITNLERSVEKNLQIAILDINDNPPQLQTDEPLTIDIEDPHFRKDAEVGSRSIMFSDNDSLNVNSRIVYEIINDTSDILVPQCKAYEADHEGLKASAINCKLLFARSGILRQSPYCVELKASDPTVEIQNNRVYKAVSAKICLTTDLDKIHELEKPAAQALQSGGMDHFRKKSRKNRKYVSDDSTILTENLSQNMNNSLPVIKYPRDAIVYRHSENLSRIAEPTNVRELMKLNLAFFKITEDRTNALGVTPVGGIVYVRNTTALLLAEEMLYYLSISWQKGSVNIIIHLEDNHPNYTCQQEHSPLPVICSEIGTKKECSKTCGVGTDGNGCQWRNNTSPGVMTINYSTCSTNLTYCPDNICDPLEDIGQRSGQFICPQDCALAYHIFGPHVVNENGRGIRAGYGLCTCDEFSKCSCAPHEMTSRTKKNRKSDGTTAGLGVTPSTSIKQQGFITTCDLYCQLFVVFVSIGLTLILVLLIMCRRNCVKKNLKKLKKQKLENDERDGNTDGQTDVPLVPVTSEFTFKTDGDPKWEFPRSQLVLDITLGEGEFGKVVRGYATNIQNKPGVTTVAVKMLKSTANSVELLALLSEFQLLQEVCHPNVIQLFGACTQESPMIIIEYAAHGSLRNYLRLSRKLECHGLEFSNGVEPVKVKDILSFAWQICKGMAYLTEIKLVHRDLAARNVLLTENKVCKISDFGLTRDVYEDDAYLKRSKDRVPVKWMAPESLADHVYTTRSDVWAFGVLAWELITLGASPYPGVPPQNLYHLLKTGYRMERPENCSEEIYKIIRSCWADDPAARPPFKLLASQWERLLGNNTKYLELEQNSVSNPMYCSNGNIAETKLSITTSMEDLDEPDKIDHLWKPPYTSDTNPKTNLNGTVILGYDIPRPLIEAKTIEQHLKYQNELAMPMNVRNLHKSCRTSQPPFCITDDVPHYASPIKRRKSYMDMTGNSSNGYNLDVRNVDKKLSKDISFRFSSLLNLNEQMTSLM